MSRNAEPPRWPCATVLLLCAGLLSSGCHPRRFDANHATARELVIQGERLMGRGDLKGAAEMAFRARHQDRSLPGAHNLLGILYAQTGQPALAAGSFQEALRLDPKLLSARTNLARLQVASGNSTAALLTLGDAVQQAPNNAEVCLLVGQAEEMRGNYGTALDYLTRAVKADPKLAEAHFSLGVLQADQNRYTAATPEFEQAYALGDRAPALLLYYSLSLLSGRGNEQDARQAAEFFAAAGKQETPLAWYVEGLLRERQKDFKTAESDYRKVLARDPHNERAQFALARSLRAGGDAKGAAAAMAVYSASVARRQRLNYLHDQITAKGPKPNLLREYGTTLLEAGHPQDAEEQFRLWTELDPKQAEPREWLKKAQLAQRRRGGS